MSAPSGLKIADWGEEVHQISNAVGNPLYKEVELDWSQPALWEKRAKNAPVQRDAPCLYALMRDHGNSARKKPIIYIGLSKSPKARFYFHPAAREIVDASGTAFISFAYIEFAQGKNRIEKVHKATEEIEHLLIWSVWHNLTNERKMYTLPGMGKNRGNAWHIFNKGYRFHGQMPKEIVYPWMLVRPRRDRSAKF